jgi:hypothetical protein
MQNSRWMVVSMLDWGDELSAILFLSDEDHSMNSQVNCTYQLMNCTSIFEPLPNKVLDVESSLIQLDLFFLSKKN